jgi:negative regulator of flagellin synthesis FlgM
MTVSNIKNMPSQAASYYEKSSGASGVDAGARQTGAGQAPDRSVGTASSPNVTVDISSKSQDFVQIKNAVAQLPEVREDVVQALKAQIESGAYTIDSQKIAGKMVRESLLDIFA